MGYPAVIQLKPAPHAGQLKLLELLEHKRFVLAPCGRRFGKTLALQLYGLRQGINYKRNIWWVDPIRYLAKRAYRQMLGGLNEALIAEKSKSELFIELINGTRYEFHSAERGDRMRGEGVHLALLNEASLIKEKVWSEVLYPMLTDTGGQAALNFTPQGKGHFTHKLFQWGMADDHPDYGSIQLPTLANPFVNPKFIEAAKRDIPADSFRQEYLAKFLDDGSGVFRGIQACVKGQLDSVHAIPQIFPYVGGLDLGQLHDYCVLDILDARGRLAWHDRFNRQNWGVMKARIIEAAKRYGAHLLVESNSIGGVIIDDLREAGVSVEGHATTAKSKQPLIQGLMVAIEQGLISYPEIPELLYELGVFEYSRTKSGHIQYSAPEGSHDDEVIALALAVKAYRDQSKAPRNTYLNNAEVEAMLGQRRAA